jgi:copper chaperone CopZ
MTTNAKPISLPVQGMSCASCVAHVEGALSELDGVTSATVNLGLGTARVTYIPGVVTVSTMKQAAQGRLRGRRAQHRRRRPRPRAPGPRGEIRRQGRNLLIAGASCWATVS